ncbi:MAG: Na+/H+ antiporter subunit E [Clostridiaceae bacterium]
MKKLKAIFSTFIFCYIFWLLYTLSFDKEELIAGVLVSLVVAIFSAPFFIEKDPFLLFNPKRILTLLIFIPIYLVELFKSNLDVALRALSKEVRVNPGIVKVETDLKSDYGLAMLSNCITLTPGTITMEIAEDKNEKCYLYIHWIDVKTRDIKQASKIIKGSFEPYVGRIFN